MDYLFYLFICRKPFHRPLVCDAVEPLTADSATRLVNRGHQQNTRVFHSNCLLILVEANVGRVLAHATTADDEVVLSDEALARPAHAAFTRGLAVRAGVGVH